MLLETLYSKKMQIITYYDQEFHKYLLEYQTYDSLLK
jgi:hypothetical protein